MLSASFPRKVALLLLLLALVAAPWAAAAGPRSGDVRPAKAAAPISPHDLVSRLWGFLATVWSETGCHIDPSGGCAPPNPQPDEGCHIDPSGGCRS